MKRTIFSALLAVVLCLSLAVCASAASGIWDEAELLSSGEENRLSEKLQEVSRQYRAEIAVMTVSSVYDDLETYTKNAYDELELGYGEDRAGVLLVVCMELREYHIVSDGFAGEAIDDWNIDSIGEAVAPHLSDGDYAAAFDEFAEQCAYYLDGYQNGFPFHFGKNLLICLVIGLIVGIVTVSILKGHLKTVRPQNRANAYVKPGSMKVTVRQDIYLYRNVTRTRKESGGPSGSRSSRSSGGGKF